MRALMPLRYPWTCSVNVSTGQAAREPPEPAHLQFNLNGTPAAGQVMQAAPVTVVTCAEALPQPRQAASPPGYAP